MILKRVGKLEDQGTQCAGMGVEAWKEEGLSNFHGSFKIIQWTHLGFLILLLIGVVALWAWGPREGLLPANLPQGKPSGADLGNKERPVAFDATLSFGQEEPSLEAIPTEGMK